MAHLSGHRINPRCRIAALATEATGERVAHVIRQARRAAGRSAAGLDRGRQPVDVPSAPTRGARMKLSSILRPSIAMRGCAYDAVHDIFGGM